MSKMTLSVDIITSGQITKISELISAGLRKSGFESDLVQHVIESQGAEITADFLISLQKRVNVINGTQSSIVKSIDRTRSPKQVLEAINDFVVSTIISGFRLINLLGIIAIIGMVVSFILASVVLYSLNKTQDKFKDASIRASMSSIRVQAELYYIDAPNSYGDILVATSCTTGMFSDPTVKLARANMELQGTSTAVCTSDKPDGINDQAYAMSVVLSDGTSLCIDSKGNRTNTVANTGSC